MPYASVIRTPSGITLAKVAVIAGGALALLLIALWIYAMVVLDTFGSPGAITILAVGVVTLGVFRLTAESRVNALVAQYPQAFMLHVVLTGAHRKQFVAFANDAGLDAKLPFFGGRFTLVATAEWVRVYRGAANPTAVIEIPINSVSAVSLATKKSFLATQSVLTFELSGLTRTWPADAVTVYYRTITPAAIPEQFHAAEIAAMNAVTHPAAS